ncbi:luciferase-like monooxygenase [Bradyrhizobium stylosanthis]|uniref:Luciferase-like monooxygenase n=1 Tax=Bradyrhizobium stylosanthis TaxID=1803665 RepID=A0A560D4J1_9BRAD|nr:luciferase-like monooxygenase [Bradyrhizobium stylosanthis]
MLRGTWTEEKFTLKGNFYRFNDYSLKPKPLDPLPEIFQGGSSRAARDMAARVSNGLKTQVDDIRTNEEVSVKGWRTKIGINAFGIIRQTECEAKEVLRAIIDKAIPDAVRVFHHEVQNAGNASPEREGNWAKSTFQDLVQYNDGFRSNLIGTPQQVAERSSSSSRLVPI